MNLPRISIVVPSFNQGLYLEETLLSLLDQQYPDLELFVVDGGSTDDSVDIIKKYEDRIDWWVSEKDKGQSEAINKGLTKVSGEIVSWVNSDDLLVPGSLQTIAAIFSKLPQSTGLIHGGAIIFDANKEIETRYTYQSPNKEAYLSGMVFPQPAAFFRKTVLDKVGLLNEGLHYGMDYDLFLRMALVCDFLPVKDVFAKYRLHQNSKSIAESNRFISDWKRSFVNLCKHLGWKSEIEFLGNSGFYINEINYHHEFLFQYDFEIVGRIEKRKVLCLQLFHVLKDLYWIDKTKDARKLKKIIHKNFSNNWIAEDLRLKVILSKLMLPDFVLNSIRKVKRIFNSKTL